MSDDRSVTDEPATRPKGTPLFVPDPGPRSREYVPGVDELGRPEDERQADSPEAASHWDRRHWRRGMIGS